MKSNTNSNSVNAGQKKTVRLNVRQFPPPVKRGRVAAWWCARNRVRDNMPLSDHLRERLADYNRARPQFSRLLPAEVVLVNGGSDVAIQENPTWNKASSTEKAEQLRKKAEELRPVIDAMKSEHGKLVSDIAVQEDAQAKKVQAGELVSTATLGRDAAARGRPMLKTEWLVPLLLVAAAVALLVEAWLYALPQWDQDGIDISHLFGELMREPMTVLLGAGYGLVMTAVSVVLAHLFVDWIVELFNGKYRGAQAAAKAIGILGTATVWVGIAWHVARQRQELSGKVGQQVGEVATSVTFSAADSTFWVYFGAAALLPLVVGVVVHTIKRRREERNATLAAQAGWDAEEELARKALDHDAELLRVTRIRKGDVDSKLTVARDELAQIESTLASGADDWQFDREAEFRYGMAFVTSVHAALELDRSSFVQRAYATGKSELLEPRRNNRPVGIHATASPIVESLRAVG